MSYTKLKIEVSEGLDYPVKIEQVSKLLFVVTYGEMVYGSKYYNDAMKQFAGCIEHSAACMNNFVSKGLYKA